MPPGSPYMLVELENNAMAAGPENNTMTVEPEGTTIMVAPRTSEDEMTLLGRWKKQPGETIDYPIDFADWLAEHTGDSITSYTVTATTGISIAAHRRVGTVITVILAGGTSGVTYQVTVRATMTSALVKEVDFKVTVKEV